MINIHLQIKNAIHFYSKSYENIILVGDLTLRFLIVIWTLSVPFIILKVWLRSLVVTKILIIQPVEKGHEIVWHQLKLEFLEKCKAYF